MLCKETEIGRLARSPSSCNTPLARVEMWSKASGSRLIFLKPLAYMVSLKHTCINVPQLSIETPSRVLSLVQRRWAVQLMFVAAWADPLASGQSKPLENTHGHIFYFCLQSQEMCSAFKGLSVYQQSHESWRYRNSQGLIFLRNQTGLPLPGQEKIKG